MWTASDTEIRRRTVRKEVKMLEITKKIDGSSLFMSLEGRLDSFTSEQFEAELVSLPEEVTSVTLDFEKLEYVSSAGLRVLLSLEQAMEDKGDVTLLHVNEGIMEIFEMTGFDEILKFG